MPGNVHQPDVAAFLESCRAVNMYSVEVAAEALKRVWRGQCWGDDEGLRRPPVAPHGFILGEAPQGPPGSVAINNCLIYSTIQVIAILSV